MVEFIKQEANEKANEIRVAADEVRLRRVFPTVKGSVKAIP